jgi:hypothetical protein
VLDPSLLDASPPEADDAPAPRRVVARPPKPPAKKRPPAAKKRSEKAAAQDWRAQISEEDWKASAMPEREAFVVDRAMDPEDVLTQAWQYLVGLALTDKLALGGAGVMLTATLFPWRETIAEGEVLGVMSSGVVVTILGVLAVGGIVVRTRGAQYMVNPVLPWIMQLGCVGFSALWCLIAMKQAWDPTIAQSPIGNYQVWVSKPVFGLFLSLGAGIASLVGTIFGLKDLGAPR